MNTTIHASRGWRRALPLFALLIGSSTSLALAQGGTPPGEFVHSGIPPAVLGGVESWEGMENLGATYNVFGKSSHQLHAKKVVIDYRGVLASSGALVVEDDIVESVSFWPTCVTFLAPDLVAVAGKGQDAAQQSTVIELWRLSQPQVRASIDPATGQSSLDLFPIGIRSKTTIYDEAAEGRDMVRAMLRLRGTSSRVLVQFHDSGDLYSLDYADALVPPTPPDEPDYPLVKLFRATPGSDVPYVTDLGNKQRLWMHGAEHDTLGYTYVFWSSFEVQTSQGANTPLPLVFFDADRNGTLDAWEQATALQNQSSGILDETQYSEKFLKSVW